MEVGSGLDGCEQFMDVNEMIRDEDLLGHRGSASGNGEASARDFFAQPQVLKQEVHELVATMVPGGLSRSLSARERNMLKRKAKVSPRDGAKEWVEEEESEEPTSKRAKQTKSVISEQSQGGDTKV
jgi:TATA-binding protein-associated factor